MHNTVVSHLRSHRFGKSSASEALAILFQCFCFVDPIDVLSTYDDGTDYVNSLC